MGCRSASLMIGVWLLASSLALAGGERVVLTNVDRYRVMEPVAECVRVALAQRGEIYSPAYLQGISGAAFRVGGPCPCAPTCNDVMEPVALLRLLGYGAEALLLSSPGVDVEPGVRRVVARVKEEVRAGRPVIVWHAFTNYEWDVVCGFDEETKQFLGRGSYQGVDELATAAEGRMAGGSDVRPDMAVIVGEKTGAYNARTAELTALEDAVRHAHAPKDQFLAERAGHELPWRFRRGLACYEGWISRFIADPRRIPDAGDRYCLGIYRSTHRAAAEFLRELVPKYPEVASHFGAAAARFEAEADALDGFYQLCGGWAGWQEPDAAKAAQAAKLLKAARNEYAAGIGEIEKALGVIAPDRANVARRTPAVRRDGVRVWIEGLNELRFGQGRDCTYLGATARALAVTGRPYEYADLMGLTGLAFRTRWCNGETATKWCHSAAIGELPDEGTALGKATGWRMRAQWIEPEGRDNDRLCKQIVAAIDAGRPVLSYPSTLDVGVIYGYEDGGKVVLVRDYCARETSLALPVGKLGPLQFFLQGCGKRPPLHEALMASLQIAVTNWRRQRHDGGLPGREYWYGEAALKAWKSDLARFGSYDEATQQQLASLDGWCYLTLCDARRAAGSFLKDWSTILTGPSREALLKAAAIYEQEVAVLKGAQDRESRIKALTEARHLEREAVRELERCLEEEGELARR